MEVSFVNWGELFIKVLLQELYIYLFLVIVTLSVHKFLERDGMCPIAAHCLATCACQKYFFTRVQVEGVATSAM